MNDNYWKDLHDREVDMHLDTKEGKRMWEWAAIIGWILFFASVGTSS